jgi:hypothetical protein
MDALITNLPTPFRLFPKLSDELRLMIWEYTWPGPRMIEGITCEDEEAEEYITATNLRIAGPLSALLEQDFGTRTLGGNRFEECPPPVALQVCHESRKHTLSQYHTVESMAGPFYVNPYRDILWLSMDLTDEPECLQDLIRYHERELNTFTTVLVEEYEWAENTPAGYASKYLAHLRGLQTILIVRGDFDEDSGELMEINTTDLYARADEVRA